MLMLNYSMSKKFTLRQKVSFNFFKIEASLKRFLIPKLFSFFKRMKLLDRYETLAEVGFDESSLLFEGGGIFLSKDYA